VSYRRRGVWLICSASSAPPYTTLALILHARYHVFSPQLHGKVIIRVIVIPALFPKMCVAVGDLCLLFCPVCPNISFISFPRTPFFVQLRVYGPSTGKSSNSSSSSSCAAGFLSAFSGCSPFLVSGTTAFFVSALPWAEPDILAVGRGVRSVEVVR
jgi:hypothetical protein